MTNLLYLNKDRFLSLLPVQEALSKYCDYDSLQSAMYSFGETLDHNVAKNTIRRDMDIFFDNLDRFVKDALSDVAFFAYVEVFMRDDKLKTVFGLVDKPYNTLEYNDIIVHIHILTSVMFRTTFPEHRRRQFNDTVGPFDLRVHATEHEVLKMSRTAAWPNLHSTMDTNGALTVVSKMYKFDNFVQREQRFVEFDVEPCVCGKDNGWTILFFIEVRKQRPEEESTFFAHDIDSSRFTTPNEQEMLHPPEQTDHDACWPITLSYGKMFVDASVAVERSSLRHFLQLHRTIQNKVSNFNVLKTKFDYIVPLMFEKNDRCESLYCKNPLCCTSTTVFKTSERDGVFFLYRDVKPHANTHNWYVYGNLLYGFFVDIFCRKHSIIKFQQDTADGFRLFEEVFHGPDSQYLDEEAEILDDENCIFDETVELSLVSKHRS